MTPEEKRQVAEGLVITAQTFRHVLTDAACRMMVEDLDDLSSLEVLHALKEYRKTTKRPFMPTVAEIRQLARPPMDARDIGLETASRIRSAISKFGWPSPQKAREYIGEQGWDVVERFGGWQHLCENLGTVIQETTFMAQCRDVVASQVNLTRAGVDLEKPALEQSSGPRGEIGAIVKSLADKKSLPGGKTE